MKDNQAVLPVSLWANSVGLAHEGHRYADKTLQLLRQTCWFPGMRKQVQDFVASCLRCNAAQPNTHPVPRQPNFLPDRPWQKVHADFKRPIGGKYYLHAVIDQYSKFPEVDLVSSTNFKKLKPILDRIFATHGIPESPITDNGPPYYSHEMAEYAKEMGFKLSPVSPEDPQCNGFADNLVKFLCKLLHTASVEGKDLVWNYTSIFSTIEPHRTPLQRNHLLKYFSVEGYKQSYPVSWKAMKQMSKRKLGAFMTRRS